MQRDSVGGDASYGVDDGDQVLLGSSYNHVSCIGVGMSTAAVISMIWGSLIQRSAGGTWEANTLSRY